jgi:4-amino-4-deoxy-L-arabinose transferase-like glycosyltransferase
MQPEENRYSFFKLSQVQWLTLGLFAAIILSINIWSDGIYSAQEGRAAIVARQMIKTGNWFHLNIKGAHNTEKPIMCYWFYALCGMIFGVNEFSVRLPSIIAALATVFMTCSLGIRIYGRQTGFLAGFMLASMVGFVNLGRLARIDIVLCAFYTAAMYLLYTGYFEKMKANWRLYLFYLVLALSVMVKGPVSVALVALTVIVLAIKERNWKIFWELKPISGLLIGLAINAPWYIYEIMRTKGEFAEDFFLNQNISRFTGINMTYSGGKRKSFFYYLPKLFAFTLPWSLLLPFALFKFRRKFLKLKPATYYLLIWFAVVFIFFSLAAIKRGDYLLPLFAPGAILLGRYLQGLLAENLKLSKKWIYAWITIAVFSIIALAGVRLGILRHVGELVVQDKITFICYRDGMGMVQASDLINSIYVLCCIALAGGLTYLYALGKMMEKGQITVVLNSLLVIILLFFCVFYIWIDPSQNKYKTVKYFCERSRQHVKPNEKVCYYAEWITETVFFMNRDYERYSKASKIYDAQSGKIKYKYIITEPKIYNNFPPEIKSKLQKLEETIPDHQYPHILLCAK